MRIKLTLAYEGSGYSGWQVQEKSCQPPTIQGALERALFHILGRKIRVHGSGRTDAGVHAHGQCAHLDLEPAELSKCGDWRRSLNALLPHDIRILAFQEAPADFHARDSATSKTYVYSLWPEPAFIPPFLTGRVWACGPLDKGLIGIAARGFLGEHDFASFQNAGTEIKSTRRSILSFEIRPLPCHEYYPPHAAPLSLVICGTGFLKQMARNIAGFVVGVGKSAISAESLEEIFMAKSRKALPTATAPAHGLALARVDYGGMFFRDIPPRTKTFQPPTTKACG